MGHFCSSDRIIGAIDRQILSLHPRILAANGFRKVRSAALKLNNADDKGFAPSGLRPTQMQGLSVRSAVELPPDSAIASRPAG